MTTPTTPASSNAETRAHAPGVEGYRADSDHLVDDLAWDEIHDPRQRRSSRQSEESNGAPPPPLVGGAGQSGTAGAAALALPALEPGPVLRAATLR